MTVLNKRATWSSFIGFFVDFSLQVESSPGGNSKPMGNSRQYNKDLKTGCGGRDIFTFLM